MRVINPIEFELMVRRINRIPTDINAVEGLLECTFKKQIGAVHNYVTPITNPNLNELYKYDEIEFEDQDGKVVKGWRKKSDKNSDDPCEVFRYFKHMLKCVEDYNFISSHKRYIAGTCYEDDGKMRFNESTKAIVDEWIRNKEAEFNNNTSLDKCANNFNGIAIALEKYIKGASDNDLQYIIESKALPHGSAAKTWIGIEADAHRFCYRYGLKNAEFKKCFNKEIRSGNKKGLEMELNGSIWDIISQYPK